MRTSAFLLAQWEGLNPLNPTAPVSKTTGLLFKDVMLIIATGLVLTLILILRARHYVRKKKRRHHHHHHRTFDSSVTSTDTMEEEGEAEETHPGRRHRRRRRRRRDHRPRNPTLAETGGLPPSKPEGPSAPSV